MMINLPQLIAHRGASGIAPENTIVAFKKARLLGASMVEFDVMLTKDNVPVVIHDENVKRTTNAKGLVNSFTLEELQQLDAGRWFAKKYAGETIPTFKAVLEALQELELQANVEIKPLTGTEAETVAMVLADINQYWSQSKPPLLISSFDYQVLEMVRTFAPEQPLGLLMDKWQEDWLEKARAINSIAIHCNYKLLTTKRVKAIKDEGFLLLAYTVNRVRRANKLLNLGVDALFTDYPDLL